MSYRRTNVRVLLFALFVVHVCCGVVFHTVSFSKCTSISCESASIQHAKNTNSSKTQERWDGPTLNGVPLIKRENRKLPVSHMDCVSADHFEFKNISETMYAVRSCRYRNLCYSFVDKKFVLHMSPAESDWQRNWTQFWDSQRNATTFFGYLSDDGNRSAVSLSPTRSGVVESGGKFQPQWKNQPDIPKTYFMLPQNYVWVPFMANIIFNPGHLLMDNFLPIYNLLSIFDLTEKVRLMMTNMQKQNHKEYRRNFGMVQKFLPLMGQNPKYFGFHQWNITDPNSLDESDHINVSWICFSNAAAGTRGLADHRFFGVASSAHGQQPWDYQTVRNVGRGPILWSFRNYMLANLGINESMPTHLSGRNQITFSILSSRNTRKTAFTAQRQKFTQENVSLTVAHLSDMTLMEQVQLALHTRVWISAAGGSNLMAIFLPRGATAVVYYGKNSHGGEFLDWDLLHNLGHIRVHWMPLSGMNDPLHLDQLYRLVRRELGRSSDEDADEDMIDALRGKAQV